MSYKPRAKRKAKKLYTKGQVNRTIDGLIHPLFESNKNFILLDAICHAVVEKNLSTTLRKFAKYSLPKILGQSAKRAKKRTRRNK